jgi:hypothetical protein
VNQNPVRNLLKNHARPQKALRLPQPLAGARRSRRARAGQTNFTRPGLAVSVEAAIPAKVRLSPWLSTIVVPLVPLDALRRTAAS